MVQSYQVIEYHLSLPKMLQTQRPVGWSHRCKTSCRTLNIYTCWKRFFFFSCFLQSGVSDVKAQMEWSDQFKLLVANSPELCDCNLFPGNWNCSFNEIREIYVSKGFSHQNVTPIAMKVRQKSEPVPIAMNKALRRANSDPLFNSSLYLNFPRWRLSGIIPRSLLPGR